MKQLFYICAMFMLISCNNEPKPEKFDKKKITAETEKMLHDYHSAINREGLMAEFLYLDHSHDFFWVPPGYHSALTYDSVQTILTQNSKALRQIKLEWSSLQIYPLSNEVASYTGIVKGQMTDTAGIETHISIIESGTLIRRTDGWKLLGGQSATLATE